MRTTGTALRRPEVTSAPEDEFALEVIDGLSRTRKCLPCRFLYDARGSELFEEITRVPEYYPTRTEAEILSEHAAEMTRGFPDDCVFVEFGSGSSLKTEIILKHLAPGGAYVPIDVSETALHDAKQRLEMRFPQLRVYPIVCDFSGIVEFPLDLSDQPRVGFFPGSTIGNLVPDKAVQLLKTFREVLSAPSRLLIGIDLKKDARTLVQAYDDAAGVTAAFNLNLLARINRELLGSFDLQSFRHEAVYDPREGRIEMHLVSTADQDARVLGRRFHFLAGESIHTENSYKYTVCEFQDLARAGGWVPLRVWTDAHDHFGVHELIAR